MGIEIDGQFGQETSRGTFLEVEGAGGAETLASYEQRMKHYGTLRARIGYAAEVPVVGQSLWYVTGGFAWARNKIDLTAFEGSGGPTNFSDSKTLTGYAVGGVSKLPSIEIGHGRWNICTLTLAKRLTTPL
jgi:opacity protein-like surface antigen